MFRFKSLFCLAIVMALISCLCTACAPSQPPTPTATPLPTATPTPGVGGIKGKLVPSGGTTVGNIKMGLWSTGCEGSGGWQQMNETELEAKTDESGAFLFEGVPSGCYVMFAIVSSQTIPFRTEGGMALIEVPAGQTVDMGSLPFSQ